MMEKQKIDLERLKAARFLVCDTKAINMELVVPPSQRMEPAAIEALENRRDEIIKNVNIYLKIFAAPIKSLDLDVDGKPQSVKCINCDHALTGLFGSFEYGIRHGEGACSKCGYPGRANHYIKHEGFNMTFIRILQYHPSQLERKVEHGNNGD